MKSLTHCLSNRQAASPSVLISIVVCLGAVNGGVALGQGSDVDVAILAQGDRGSVERWVMPDQSLRLVVRDISGKTTWSTQPSSGHILADLSLERMVVFRKARNEGFLDIDREGPMRGADIFSLSGELIVSIDAPIRGGVLVGPYLVASYESRGIACYRVTDGSKLWENAKIWVNESSYYHPDRIVARQYDHSKGLFINYLINARNGDVLMRFAGRRETDPRILSISPDAVVRVTTVTGDDQPPRWVSEVVGLDGERLSMIDWPGQPIAARFAKDGKHLAAVCAVAVEGDQIEYRAVICDAEGKPTKNRLLFKTSNKGGFVPQISVGSSGFQFSLTIKSSLPLRP